MRNFNVFTSNRRKEVAAAAVGALAVTSLLSGCEAGKASGGITAEAVGEHSGVLSGAKEPTSAGECLLELTQAWTRDAQQLPENHQDPEGLAGYGVIWRDGKDAYNFRLAAEDDANNPTRDRVTVFGTMYDPQDIPMEESDTGIMRFKGETLQEGVPGRNLKYHTMSHISVPKVEGQTPFETLLESDIDDVLIDDLETPLKIYEGERPNHNVADRISTVDVDLRHSRDVSEYCSITQDMYNRLGN